MPKDIKLTLLLLFLPLFLGAANFINALEINYPRLPGATPPQDFLTTAAPEDILSLYAKYLVNLCIWAGGLLALAGLIYGGIKYLLSTGKPEAMVSARDQIIGAFFGLLILLSSFLILKTLSPQFINLKIPTLQTVQFPLKPKIPLPETMTVNSSIDIEIPFGRVIEKIFETYISDYPEPDPLPSPRMLRIKNIARAIIGENDDGLADKLKKQSQDLKNAADNCSCQGTKPEEPCGGNKSGETTWKCDLSGCQATGPCTSDPCAKVRGDIQKTEEENFNVIYQGTEIIQLDEKDKKKKITTSLVEEQIKTEEEVRSLKEWLDRLKRAEKFINECPKRALNSLDQFYSKKDTFRSQNWTIRETKFWDDINIRYYTGQYTKNVYGRWYFQPTKEIGTDSATFYCAVSGTMEQPPAFATLAPSQQQLSSQMSVEEAEEVMSESMACSKESPVGEIIDRTKRTTQLLIDKLELLVVKDKELIDAVDKLQVLVSQCSSQRGCERRCTSFPCLPECMYKKHGSWRCRPGCKGWAYCCADSSGPYPSECKDRDEDTPCPYKEIKDQLNEVKRIWQEIRDIIDGKNSKDAPDTTGIITIIEEIVPTILEDLNVKVRIPMKECRSENWLEQTKSLFNCIQAKMATTPKGKVIRECCRTEAWDADKQKMVQTPYGDCFEECYLEKGIAKHRECVQKCLDGLAIMLGDPEIAQCTPELNFYCCP